MALELAHSVQEEGTGRRLAPRVPPPAPSSPLMTKDAQVRFVAVALALLTITAAIFAWINFQKERQFETPYDGVWWVEKAGHVEAKRIDNDGPGARAGVKTGDLLTAVDDHDVQDVGALTKQLFRVGTYSKTKYSLIRNGIPVQVPVILVPYDRSLNAGLRLIALIYLGIGLYVLLRRWTAPKATHFYLFCLASFIYFSFHYTGKLNDFDWAVYWSNVVAEILQPALFLHFVLTFPEPKRIVREHKWLIPGTYVPGALLLALRVFAKQKLQPSELLVYWLDSTQMVYISVLFLVAVGVLWHSYRRAASPILRQQMKWVTRGTTIAIVPYILFYVIPYSDGQPAGLLTKIAVLALVFLPLTFGYAIFRYRLMDVDLIFKRGMAYTLAAATIAGVYFAAVGLAAEIVHTRLPSAGPSGLIVAIMVTALLFDPMKNWIQDRLDMFFYKKRYDYRKTLIEFGRELSSQVDLDKMLSSVVDRLSRTLLVDRLAIFTASETTGEFIMAKSFGIADTRNLDLSFLALKRPEDAAGHLFFDNTHQVVRETPEAQQTIARLDLNYFIPCTVQGHNIAVLGLGKTAEGDFLSSEDVELLETVAGYIGIAIQNARLYASLEQKVIEYERLKEFNENIVESISVGVLAVDLDDRIEFWNSQMEVMFALPRMQALGRPITEVFPQHFAQEFYRVRQSPGIHNLYKFKFNTILGDDTRVTNIAIAPLVTKQFHVIGRLIIVDDITERIELETQLSQAEKMSSIGLLAAGVAHEVNTPLAVISSYAQMLAKQLQGDEKRSALLEKITHQTFRASEIVNSLLNFSRTSGTEFRDVDLNKIIHETLALLEHQMKTTHIHMQESLCPTLPFINGNAGKLQQVFLNLFLNAKDAMPQGGTLTVSTANGDGVKVMISDTGTGIAQEHIQRIYDPFFTTKTGNNGRRGTGLGLSVTYGIIQEHAGKIEVDSRVGEGTTFVVEFPLARKAVNV